MFLAALVMLSESAALPWQVHLFSPPAAAVRTSTWRGRCSQWEEPFPLAHPPSAQSSAPTVALPLRLQLYGALPLIGPFPVGVELR